MNHPLYLDQLPSRCEALRQLQQIDPSGAWTDAASELEHRRACGLHEALRSLPALIEAGTAGTPPADVLAVLPLLADWALDLEAGQ